jgi:DNA-binding transcriptional regulator YhcF (GntR family)
VSNIERPDIAKRIAAFLDSGRQQPLPRQIVDCVWLEVVDGTLQTGDRMPTVRQLSIELGLTPRAVERAYEQLEKLGVLASHTGEGTYVSLNAPDGEIRERWVKLEAICREAAASAGALGFSIDDLIDALVDLRVPRTNSSDSTRQS